MLKKRTIVWLVERVCQVACLVYFCAAAIRFHADFEATHRPTSLMTVVFVLCIMLFLVIRSFPKEVSSSPFEWVVAFLGTIMAGSFVPAGEHRVLIGELVQGLGLLITMVGLFSLNRSFAIVPANRGIKTHGLYRFVRHPLYMGYLISDVGLIINQFLVWNLIVAGFAATFFVLRIRFEEELLTRDPAYQHYCQQTRYRLIPGIW